MKATFTFLGTGASTGVPMIGCNCKTCSSTNPKNKRLRPCGLIQIDGKNILIDAGPDIREQLLREKINHLDGLLLSHPHFDHIGGLDELRVFFFKNKAPLKCLLSASTKKEVQKRYHYMFTEQSAKMSYAARFDFEVIEEDKAAQFMGLRINPVYYFQGGMEVTGFIIDDFAYLCDLKDYNQDLFDKLKGINILVVSALKWESSLMHLSLAEAVQFAKHVGAKKTYLTHLAHELEFEECSLILPKGIELSFDGLSFTFNVESAK